MPKLTKTVTTVIDVNELGQILIEHYKANTVIIQAVKVGDPGSPEIIPVGIRGGLLDIEIDVVVERDREVQESDRSDRMSKDIELTPETFKWLYSFVQDAIDGGLSDERSVIAEAIYTELSRHDLIEMVPDWDRARLTDSFVKEIVKGINLYGIIRGIIYERGCEESRE